MKARSVRGLTPESLFVNASQVERETFAHGRDGDF